MIDKTTTTADRLSLCFLSEARKAFTFLNDQGFSEIEALPTLIRYEKKGVEVDVYHGRQSYELGVGITVLGVRYSLSEIIRVDSPEIWRNFRYPSMTTPEGVANGLEELGLLTRKHGSLALEGSSEFFSILDEKRKRWSEDYALDVLAEHVRPQAEEAFRKKEYPRAFELYSKIKERLSPAEIKKLSIAAEYCEENVKKLNR